MPSEARIAKADALSRKRTHSKRDEARYRALAFETWNELTAWLNTDEGRRLSKGLEPTSWESAPAPPTDLITEIVGRSQFHGGYVTAQAVSLILDRLRETGS